MTHCPAEIRFASLTLGKEGQCHLSRYRDGAIGAVKLAKKATVTVAGIGNKRESPFIQPDRIRVAALYQRAPNTGSQRARFTFLSENSLDCQRLPPESWADVLLCPTGKVAKSIVILPHPWLTLS